MGVRTKFYLDKQNAKWMGVCSGLADYTGVDVMWIRIAAVLLTVSGVGFPWVPVGYWLIAWMSKPQPGDLYVSDADAKFWQRVRINPTRSTREVHGKFRDMDRRLADIEDFYTSRNNRLADEIDSLR